MPTTVWDAAMDAVAAQLRAVVTGTPVELDRRAPVADGECPRLVVTQGDTPAPDLTQDPGAEYHDIEITIAGHCVGSTDTATRIATNTLRAQVMAALNGYAAGVVFDVIAIGGDGVQLFDAEESAKPRGEFVQPFRVRCVTASGHPYSD
ncbi:hypothetical protein KTR66_04665 [Roseococcus sp. SDR]|uniref:hypothetical protein n=1 Tax=Roseococcus sp. SDR TaxID=2835532 RepID=UPI001BCEB09F|nr:hypothetical protein [Roseococcus sp. SDR]MBS7789272.1 hypothetical protein [Roseococcus sp. SDR]MBV1844586.1 hypothetical protein [Roseococcus sp. SDR]